MIRRRLMIVAGLGVAMHLGIVVGIAATSQEVLLPRGAVLRFCGAYLDCHLGVSVAEVETTVTETAVHHRVALRISSNARRATLRARRLQVEMIGANDERLARLLELFIPGDSESLGHQPVLLAVGP